MYLDRLLGSRFHGFWGSSALRPFCNSFTLLGGSTLSWKLSGATFDTHPKDIRMSVWKGLFRSESSVRQLCLDGPH